MSEQKPIGTIFMGPQEDRETTLDRLYTEEPQEIWNKQTEEEYMERVKAKATERVRALLVQARHRGSEIIAKASQDAEAIRLDAEQIRNEAGRALDDARNIREDALAQKESAHKEGYIVGQGEAMGQLAQVRKDLGETTAVVLLAIQEQCANIFEAWRKDLTDLLREAVEKTTSLVINQDRAAVLESLLEQSMRALLDRSKYTVRVHPNDATILTDILADAHQARPGTANWELVTDPGLSPGSLMVESATAFIDNSREARRTVVDEVLEHLTLPLSQADQNAFVRVTNSLMVGLRKNEIDVSGGPTEEQLQAAGVDPAAKAMTMVEDTAQAARDLMGGEAVAAPQQPPAGMTSAAEPAAPPAAPVAPGIASMHSVSPTPLAGAAHPVTQPVAPAAAPPVDQTTPSSAAEPAPAAPVAPVAEENHEEAAQVEAMDLVQEFLGEDTPKPPQHAPSVATPGADEENPGLPSDVADDLLAEMGFSDAPNVQEPQPA